MRPARLLPPALLLLCCQALASLDVDSETPSSRGKLALRSTGNGPVAQVLPRYGAQDHEEPSDEPRRSDVAVEKNLHHIAPAPRPARARRPSKKPDHSPYDPPLLRINETLILETHDPDPLSYLELDVYAESGYPQVLVSHVLFMSLAFFVLFPISLFLKAGGSHLALIPQAAFLITSLLGMLCGTIYNSLTPDLYVNSSHSRLGWWIMGLILALNSYDGLLFARRFRRWWRGGSFEDVPASGTPEEERTILLEEDDADFVSSPVAMEDTPEDANWSQVRGPSTSRHSRPRDGSAFSDETVFDGAAVEPVELPPRQSLRTRVVAFGPISHAWLSRSLVFLAYIQVISGIAVYTGSCRERYANGCMAYTIKGSIFVWYGILTFARYIGAFSSLGWSWNRRPDGKTGGWTMEFVESLICFLYGASNTWLERLGKTGDLSLKDVQHISIAIMFWFAGGLGMLLESRRVRSWLSQPAVAASGRHPDEIVEPGSAGFSFNPFPAMIIGVAGVAMAARQQTYQFEADIHTLWGMLLVGFACFRFLTYFILYIRPPASILPSRPPTEALAALCLTCGGLVFILSTEQVTFSALRHGADNVMPFLNVTVAVVCIWFTWILALFALKGWAVARSKEYSPRTHHRYRRSPSTPSDPFKARRQGSFA